MAERVFGVAIKRREDPRLLTGRGTYTDNLKLPGMTYAAILRSPHAHARIKSINVEKAKAHPGVVGVFTGADLTGRVVPTAWNIPASDLKTPPHPALAVDTVRHVGDGVAVVVAEDRYTAEDALELIEVEYEPLPATVNAEAATKEGAPQVHDDVPNNQAFHWKLAAGEIDKAFQEADVVVKQRLINNRVIPTAIEPRAAIAQYDANMGELTVWSTSQNPHIARFLFSALLALPEHRIRVIAPDVGGGFGSKISFYADELIVAHLAMALGRPVKWTETRRENYLATTHGRDHITEVELAAKRDGTLLGLRGTTYANMGAYLSTAAPGVPTILHGLVLPGAYRLPAVDYDVYGVFTNTTPVDAYRGAGRPEATYIIERMVDVLARELGLDPVEVRRKNFIPADQFPYTTVTAIIYDSGNYEGALNKALEIFDYQGFRQEQARLRQEGRYLGVGFSTYLEICGLAPSRVAGAVGFGGGLWEGADVRVSPTGKILVAVGTSPHGQGEEIAFAQIVAEELGISVDDVEVLHGDTARTPMGWGTYGSRTAAVSGPAILLAARKVKEKARKIAAHLLEAAEADMEFEAGKFYVRGSPDRAKTFQEVALMANVAWNMPEGMEPGLEESAFFDPPNFTYPFGTHICVVEVEPDSGEVHVQRYIAVDDCGRVINPLLVEGQTHGGATQGIAQALYEQAVYDDSGQLLSGSLMDYAIPTATMVPQFETDRTETPSPANPLGVKGMGETATIASPPAVVNAVVDALSPFGIKHLDMPLTAEKIWRALQAAGR